MIDPGTVIDLHQLGRWRYDGIQEGILTTPATWQFTSLKERYTVNLPCWLTGVPLIQRLKYRAEELLGICGTCGGYPRDCFCRVEEAKKEDLYYTEPKPDPADNPKYEYKTQLEKKIAKGATNGRTH